MGKTVLNLLVICGTIASYLVKRWMDPRYQERKREEREENESQKFRKALHDLDADEVSRLLHDRLRRRRVR